MIVIDMNQIALANLMMNMKMNNNKTIDENMVRHMILNSIRMYRKEHHNEYGEVVLTWDSKHSWRRDYFPEYKASRRKGREESDLDWEDIFGTLNKIRNEIKQNFPYKYLEVFGAEADDIIGFLCEENKNEKIMIISGDKDFIQLQKYPNVTQWSPITKKQVNGFDPTIYLKEHILKGDTSDGVPNILSPDNTFVDGLRQRPLSRKKIQSWLLGGGSDWNDEVKRNFQRNSTLIDLSRTPEELKNQIRLEYNNAPHGDRSKLLNYFMKNKLKELTENIGEF
jgi:5'-3' exonuclease